MKAILRSIKPYWLYLILKGEKIIEVGKNKLNLSTPFVTALYCSKDKMSFNCIPEEDRDWFKQYIGKVACEFVCDDITDISPFVYDYYEYSCSDAFLSSACLDEDDLLEYGKGTTLYGWHVSDLVIYDKPKELGEFYSYKVCKDYWDGNSGCDDVCGIAENNRCKCGHTALTKPPQSWCYVEEINA